MADRCFIISCPQLQFCEDVEADDYGEAINRIGISGYFGTRLEDERFFDSMESSRLFSQDLLTTYVLDTSTRETAVYELRMHFTLKGTDNDPDYIAPEVN